MPFCPSCGVEYRAGVTECADCRVPLTDTPPAQPSPEDWVSVYTGHGVEMAMVADDLANRGLTVIRAPSERLELAPVALFGSPGLDFYSLSVPRAEFAERQAEIEAAVAEIAGGGGADPAAEAEAEQDYDVRACPTCRRFFHETYTACPGDGTALLPAVECFTEGQLAPDRVVVGHASLGEAEALAARLGSTGLGAALVSPPGWSVALVDLPWTELCDRTAEVEALLGTPA